MPHRRLIVVLAVAELSVVAGSETGELTTAVPVTVVPDAAFTVTVMLRVKVAVLAKPGTVQATVPFGVGTAGNFKDSLRHGTRGGR